MHVHFVIFYSPGSFFSETTTKPIDEWSTDKALALCCTVPLRPYGFQFITRSRTDEDLDSKVTARSPMYYIGGKVETLEEITGRADPADAILIRNMRNNDYTRAVRGRGYTQPLKDGDVVL